jgi:hypothetical protein
MGDGGAFVNERFCRKNGRFCWRRPEQEPVGYCNKYFKGFWYPRLHRGYPVCGVGATVTYSSGEWRPVALAVDDDRAVVAPVGAILERDHEVITAVGVTTALDVARSQPVDIVLLDNAMSAEDDLESFSQLRLGAAAFSAKPCDRPRCARWWRRR